MSFSIKFYGRLNNADYFDPVSWVNLSLRKERFRCINIQITKEHLVIDLCLQKYLNYPIFIIYVGEHSE